jgi:hypothetical protein
MGSDDPLNALSEYQRFYLNLGSAISQWQDVEIGLLDVFHKVSASRSRHVSSAIYFAVISFETKMDMTNAAASVALGDTQYFGGWVKLLGRVSANQGIRNKLAHFSMTLNPLKNVKAKYRVFLAPNVVNPMLPINDSDREPTVYNLEQVKDFGVAFAKLGGDLTSFAESLPEPKA